VKPPSFHLTASAQVKASGTVLSEMSHIARPDIPGQHPDGTRHSVPYWA
jgi:hypothetical protein